MVQPIGYYAPYFGVQLLGKKELSHHLNGDIIAQGLAHNHYCGKF